jgi:carnitine O-palmitoyltransferase 1, liver isoform
LNDTITRYLSSIQPLVDNEKFERIKRESEEFKNGIGKKIHRSLKFKSWFSENYVSDWWESAHYLKSREPLMYGTSIYMTDNINSVTNDQAARAANLTYLMLKFREKILNQQLDVVYIRSFIPICMWQYRRLFNTTRTPGISCDKIVHIEDSKHIVVMYKGCYYKINVYKGDELYNSAELQLQIEEILQSKPSNSSTEKHIPALTAWNRTRWAEVRNEYFASGINKESLNAIESAAFVLSLDDEPYIYDLKSSPEEYGKYGKQLLVGNGHNRWFDKSFNLCVSSNGRVSSIIAMSFSLFKINILIRNSLGFTVNTHGLMHL